MDKISEILNFTITFRPFAAIAWISFVLLILSFWIKFSIGCKVEEIDENSDKNI